MKKVALLTVSLLAASFAMIFLGSCMGHTPAPPTLQDLLYGGRKNLSWGHGSVAYDEYLQALSMAPDNVEGHYGIVLALDKRVFSNIDGIIQILSGVLLENPSQLQCEQACARLEECNLMQDAWTTKETCVKDCPFFLQPYMFETLIDGSTCFRIHDVGLEWIIPTTPANCEKLCNNLKLCGQIQPPVTFDVEDCITHCPYSYVEHHTKCYMQHLGDCNGYDRSCFDHTTIGLQILFRLIDLDIPPQIIENSDWLFAHPSDYVFELLTYDWTLVNPKVDIDLHGRYDGGFMYLSRTLAYGFHALLLMATAVDLEMNFPAFSLNFTYANPQGLQPIMRAVIRTLEILMYDPVFPNGFLILDEPWAIPQIQQGGQEVGLMFASIVEMFDFMFDDHTKKEDLAFSYTDTNGNGDWDPDETLTISGLGLTITLNEAVAIRNLSAALRDNMAERKPFPIIATFEPVLEAFGLGSFDWVVELISSWYNDTGDWSGPFWEPTRTDFRAFVIVLIEKAKIILSIIEQMNITAPAPDGNTAMPVAPLVQQPPTHVQAR